jgi:hypothetical protein
VKNGLIIWEQDQLNCLLCHVSKRMLKSGAYMKGAIVMNSMQLSPS